MKKIFYLIIITFIFSISFAISDETNISQSLIESIAIISDYSGESLIKSSNNEKFINVELNMPVYEGDVLKTGKNSSIEITFDDATIIRLEDKSELKISELKRQKNLAKTIFNLFFGKIIAIVEKLNQDSTFEVHTKMAIAAVKGTEFAIESDEENAFIGVFDGKVSFAGLEGYGIDIDKGNESKYGKDSKIPENPKPLNNMLKFEKQLSKMREEIKIVRELKSEGKEKVIQWRIKKKLEKEGETAGQSDEKITIGGTDKEDTEKAEKRIKNYLKRKIKSELLHLREHAWNDLKWVNSEMKADLNLGKTMIDVHGNRIRIEEYIFRPNPKQIDLLSITFRKNRLDYLRAQNIFNNDLPKILPKDIWLNEWVIEPRIYKIEEKLRLSNTIDHVDANTKYELYKSGNWRLWSVEETLSINDKLKEKKIRNAGIISWTNTVPLPAITSNQYIINSNQDLAWEEKRTYLDGSWLKLRIYLIDDYGNLQTNPKTLENWIDLIFNTNVELQLLSSEFNDKDLGIDVVSKILWWTVLNPKK